MRVIGLGAGGHGKVLLDALQVAGGYEVVGILDDNPALHGTQVLGVQVLGSLDMLAQIRTLGVAHAFLGVGSVGSAATRRRLYARLLEHGYEPLEVRHPSSILAPSVRRGRGLMALARVVVNADSRIGENVILNTGCLVEHDCRLGDHVHISPGAVLCGMVEVGEGAHVGAGAVIRQGLRVGPGAVVGAGAAVVQDVPAGVTVVGVPARPRG